MSIDLVESGGVEPHPILHQDLVFKTSRGTNSPASLSIIWRYQGVTIPLLSSDSAVCVHEHLGT